MQYCQVEPRCRSYTYNAAIQRCSLNNSTSVAYYVESANREEETYGFLTNNVWMYAP